MYLVCYGPTFEEIVGAYCFLVHHPFVSPLVTLSIGSRTVGDGILKFYVWNKDRNKPTCIFSAKLAVLELFPFLDMHCKPV